MRFKSLQNKFREHLKEKGLFYAFGRGLKYIVYLARTRKARRFLVAGELTRGDVKVAYGPDGVHISWKGRLLTRTPGLSCAVNTWGLWTDSSKADWQFIEEQEDRVRIAISFKELPIRQVWTIELEEKNCIYWSVDMELAERLHIDEFRFLSLLGHGYKTWVSGYVQGNFPRLDHLWRDLWIKDQPGQGLVAVRFPLRDEELPSYFMESLEDKGGLCAIVQNPPSHQPGHFIGFRKPVDEDKKEYGPGSYRLFRCKIFCCDRDEVLDSRIENLRQWDLEKIIPEKKANKVAAKSKILCVNLPWKREGVWGVRAGSRWPHIKDASEENYLPFPFFLAYAVSLLKKNGFDAVLTDCLADEISDDIFAQTLSKGNIDILVAETSIPSFSEDMRLLKKSAGRGVRIVLCGAHPQIYAPEFLKEHDFIDFVLFGEYEWTLLELAWQLSLGATEFSCVTGLIWRDSGGSVVKNPGRPPFDINLLPWPERDSLPMKKYWDLPGNIPQPSVQMVASRGCPFSCNFCLWPQVLFGAKTYRPRHVKDCVDEMEYLVREKGFKSVYFDDDTFNVGKERMLAFCKEIRKRGLEGTPWAIMAKADLMDEEILRNMKDAGLAAVKYGIESAAQELVDRCGKCLDLKKAEKMISATKALGIKVHLTFAFGLPGETEETIRKTVDFALRMDPYSVQFSIVTPFPGTELFRVLEGEERILTKDWASYDGHTSCVFKPDGLSSSQLEEAKHNAYRMWVEYQRKKRGLKGDVARFFDYFNGRGLRKALEKTSQYLMDKSRR